MDFPRLWTMRFPLASSSMKKAGTGSMGQLDFHSHIWLVFLRWTRKGKKRQRQWFLKMSKTKALLWNEIHTPQALNKRYIVCLVSQTIISLPSKSKQSLSHWKNLRRKGNEKFGKTIILERTINPQRIYYIVCANLYRSCKTFSKWNSFKSLVQAEPQPLNVF